MCFKFKLKWLEYINLLCKIHFLWFSFANLENVVEITSCTYVLVQIYFWCNIFKTSSIFVFFCHVFINIIWNNAKQN